MMIGITDPLGSEEVDPMASLYPVALERDGAGVPVRARIGVAVVDEYLAYLATIGRPPTTFASYAYDLTIVCRWLKQEWPDREVEATLRELTPALVLRFVEQQRRPRASKPPVALRTVVRTPWTVKTDTLALGAFFRWLTAHHPHVADLRQLDRQAHLEPFVRWVHEEAGPGRARGEAHGSIATRVGTLNRLRQFFRLIALWGWPDAPARPLLVPDDVPPLPEPLPRALDDVEAARMIQSARTNASQVERLIIELLAGCALRTGEARDPKLADLVTFGGGGGQAALQTWLRVPRGKLANDRYVPVGAELQDALDAFLAAEHSSREWEGLPSPPP